MPKKSRHQQDHAVPVWPQSRLRITEEADENGVCLRTHYLDTGYAAEDESFETALSKLIAQLPKGISPQMCAACRLAVVDPFSASDMRNDISCYRRRPDLLDDYKKNGRHAKTEFFQYLGKDPVDAFFSCAEFDPISVDRKSGNN